MDNCETMNHEYSWNVWIMDNYGFLDKDFDVIRWPGGRVSNYTAENLAIHVADPNVMSVAKSEPKYQLTTHQVGGEIKSEEWTMYVYMSDGTA